MARDVQGRPHKIVTVPRVAMRSFKIIASDDCCIRFSLRCFDIARMHVDRSSVTTHDNRSQLDDISGARHETQ